LIASGATVARKEFHTKTAAHTGMMADLSEGENNTRARCHDGISHRFAMFSSSRMP